MNKIERLEAIERGEPLPQTPQKTSLPKAVAKSVPSALVKTVTSIGQGAGWATKKAGLGSGLYDVSTKGAEAIEKWTKHEREQQPWAFWAGELATDIATPFALGKVAKTGKLMPKRCRDDA